ncbi:MAG: SGNH/GDSL hydrolase family protein [Cyanobium sp.]
MSGGSAAMQGDQPLIVFGDSLCDVGNAWAQRGDAAFACPPHWHGRRCDGPLWVEHMAAALGLPLPLHSLAGGTNHAFGGARSGAGLSAKGMPNLLEQVEGFLRTPAAAEALVVLRAGANDYLDAPPSPAVGEAVNRHLLAAVERLAEAGLRRFVVPSELPWGFSPIQLPGLGEAERRGLNALIARQNAALHAALAELAARRGLVVVQPDFHALLLAVRADPEAHGFTEIERPVLGPEGEAEDALAGPAAAAPLPCPGDRCPQGLGETPAAAGLLWWDSWAHLTAAFHRLLAAEALKALAAAGFAGPQEGAP